MNISQKTDFIYKKKIKDGMQLKIWISPTRGMQIYIRIDVGKRYISRKRDRRQVNVTDNHYRQGNSIRLFSTGLSNSKP